MTRLNDQQIENEIQEKGKTAPRITPGHIDDTIVEAKYHRFEGTTTIVCCLVLTNGYTVIGESASASPENFDEEIGRRIANDHARDKIWALEGYLLKQALYEQGLLKQL